MKHIAPEDRGKISNTIRTVIEQLGTGTKRIELDVYVGDDLPVATLVGHWINDMIRIDIKFKY